MPLLYREADALDVSPPDAGDAAGDGRTVAGRLVPYGTPATVRDPDGATYEETWARGAAAPADPLLVYAWHDPATGARGPLVGRATEVTQRDDGFHAQLRIADSTDGRDALALLREGLDGLSVEFAPDVDAWDDARRAVTRERAVVSAVAFAARPAHPTARVLELRSTQPERPAMTAVTTTPVEPDAPPDDPPDPDDPARAAAHLRSIGEPRGAPRITAAPAPASQFRSFGEFARSVAMGAVPMEQRAQLFRALADEVSADVPGLMPPGWVREIVDLMGEVSGTINAFRSRPLPDAGMTITFPRVDQGPDVGLVTQEKPPSIPTRKVLVGAVPFQVQTYAGGQDISIVVLTRSDPAYLDLVMRLYAREMALQVNQAFAEVVVAAAAAGPAWPADLTLLGGAIIDASMQIVEATYSMPQVAVLGRDAWAAMGKANGTDGRPLFPGVSPTNPVGSFTLSTNTGDARGLDYVMDPSIAPDTIVIGLRDAAISMLGPVGTLAADNPERLGRDVAVYRFAAFGVVDPRGLVKITGAPAAAAASSSRRSTKGE